jgi:uncharacterized protein YjdB
MKRIKIITLAILLAVFSFAPANFLINESVVTVQAATLKISSKTATLEVGQTKKLTISGTKKKVSWSSGKKTVATVSSSGTITAKAAGTATITAKVSGKKLTCKVTVVPKIKISANTLTLESGNSQTLKISGTTKTPAWSSSDKSVATVSGKGTVSAVKEGSATVTASVGGKKLTCKITVVPPVTISSSALTLEAGETETLKINGTTKTPVWSSSDRSVAIVSGKGTVFAVKEGSATITASVAGKKLTSNITVITPITLSDTSLTLEAGASKKLQLSGGASTTLWTSSQKDIAQVSIDGTVTAARAGTAIITAYVDGKELKCSVTVTNPSYISEIGMNINLGDKTVAVTAQGVTEGVIFASGNPLIATVASDGYITPLAVGTTTVTASIGDKVYSYLVTVTDPAHPYIKNAPFKASTLAFDKLSFVVPEDWQAEEEIYSNDGCFILQPNSSTSSNIIISIYKADESAPRYRIAKEEFRGYLTETYIREEYDAMFKEVGISYQLSNFRQSDYQADFGKVFSTEYSIGVGKEQIKQDIYLFYIDKYIVQITMTDAGDVNNFKSNVKYILNSFILQ